MAEKVDQMDPDEKIVEIAIERLRVFENHPFRVEMDSQMKDLQDSIKQYGIITPVIVRPRKEGYYEIISGHRRIFAAEKLGYRKVPTIIRYMTDDQAVIAMVDSNLQRERIQPSEKAFAYKMKYDVLKRKSGRRKAGQVDHNSGKKGLSDCQEMHFELMENDNPNLNHVIGKLWTKLNQKENMLSAKVIEDFREQTEEHFHPVDGMNAGEIKEMVSYYVQAKIIENKLDVKVENVILSGSRCRGIEKIGSDLDVMVDYKGTIREDDFFNILHEESFAIAGIAVDINPITEDKMGSLAKYLESAEQYLKEKTQERKLEKPSVREKIKQAKQITQEKKKVNTEKSKNAER
ncbi:ParB/RepB/Spo0J family partition protein [Eubacterium ramulus]|uniref:ParB/RepB/Spo0J family partition protein n=1 Tax=Eubacterium ramulus TaxID=39490 RepID=UPI0030B90F75